MLYSPRCPCRVNGSQAPSSASQSLSAALAIGACARAAERLLFRLEVPLIFKWCLMMNFEIVFDDFFPCVIVFVCFR